MNFIIGTTFALINEIGNIKCVNTVTSQWKVTMNKTFKYQTYDQKYIEPGLLNLLRIPMSLIHCKLDDAEDRST